MLQLALREPFGSCTPGMAPSAAINPLEINGRVPRSKNKKGFIDVIFHGWSRSADSVHRSSPPHSARPPGKQESWSLGRLNKLRVCHTAVGNRSRGIGEEHASESDESLDPTGGPTNVQSQSGQFRGQRSSSRILPGSIRELVHPFLGVFLREFRDALYHLSDSVDQIRNNWGSTYLYAN